MGLPASLNRRWEGKTKPFRRVHVRKDIELIHAWDIKGPARLSGPRGLKRPIGCRQRQHVVLKKNEKARRGIHANENIKNI